MGSWWTGEEVEERRMSQDDDVEWPRLLAGGGGCLW
jgi:hypothetical protein